MMRFCEHFPAANHAMMGLFAAIALLPLDQAGAADPLARLDAGPVRMAVEDLATSHPDRYPGAAFLTQLGQWEEKLGDIRAGVERGDPRALEDAGRFEAFKREALLANPLLDFDRLLLIKRKPLRNPRLAKNDKGLGAFNGIAQQSSFQVYRMPDLLKYENEIAVLSNFRKDPALTTLFKPPYTGLLSDVDLHFDAGRLAFCMVNPKGRFHLFELNADGTGLRQLSPDCKADDVDYIDPCYLPDDNLLFLSSAAFQGVPCNRSIKVAMSYVMERTAGTIRQLTFEQDHNYTPSVMNDGRVLYLRWEYTDIPHVWGRRLFTMNPDGTGQRAIYGSGSYWPNSIFGARAIPDSRRMAGIVTGHHEGRDGIMVIIDPVLGSNSTDGIVQQVPGFGKKLQPAILDKLTEGQFPRMLHPWPLSDHYFIVTAKPSPDALWGIYLVDIFDNMTLLKEEEGFALYEPVPLQARKRPPVIADRVDPAAKDALVSIEDIYSGPGLAGVPHGSVRELRVFTYHFAYQDTAGIDDRIGADGPWEPKRVLGTVPVEEDGSVFFKVPANTPVSIQPLDADGRALQLMRSWMTAMPGEAMSCTGCHEGPAGAPLRSGPSLAMRRAPSRIQPWKGPERGFSFKRDVQPVVDRFCVSCHHGQSGGAAPDLRGAQGFVYAYNNQTKPQLVKADPQDENLYETYSGVFEPAYIELRRLVRVGGLESDIRLLNPCEFNANTSELIQLLAKGHHGVELDRDAWDRLHTWIDLNAPAHGTWGEAIGTRKITGHAGRRLELARLYAETATEGERVPELPKEAIEAVKPARQERPGTVVPNPDGWPFDAPTAARLQTGKPLTLELGDGVSMELKFIPAGQFVAGQPGGHPSETPRAVEIKSPFWIGSCEVTNEQFARFDPTHESRFEHKGSWVFSEGHLGWPLDGPRQPVVRVSQTEAAAFCRWISEKSGMHASLPDEDQWEWACRAGSATPFSFGGLDDDFSAHANLADATIRQLAYDTDGRNTVDMVPRDGRFNDGWLVTAPVGSYQPNPWGLHDMHGNVWEWTRSGFGGTAESVARGGSWRDRPKLGTSACRIHYPGWQKVYNVGFRVVVAPPNP